MNHNKNTNKSNNSPEKSKSDQDDSEHQEQAQLAKIENMSNYLRQITLHVSATLKQPNIREILKNIVESFDKSIEEYNYEYLRRRMKKLIYFEIEQLALSEKQNYFIEKVTVREKGAQLQKYYSNLVFCKNKITNRYRMHVQIWKSDEQGPSTNFILSRYEKNCMRELYDYLTETGHVVRTQGSAVILATKKPSYQSVHKSQMDIIQTIGSYVQKFLKELNNILTKQKPCYYCNKHYIFESHHNVMMPPTIVLSLLKEPVKDELVSRDERHRILHEVCCIKYFKPPSLPQELRLPMQRYHNNSNANHGHSHSHPHNNNNNSNNNSNNSNNSNNRNSNNQNNQSDNQKQQNNQHG